MEIDVPAKGLGQLGFRAMPKIARTPEAIRAALLADPNTAAVAETIGVDVDAYIEQIIHFAMNPSAEPNVGIMTVEEMKAQGITPPASDAEIGQYLIDLASVTKASGNSNEFADQKEQIVALGKTSNDPQPVETTDQKLKEELDKQLRAKRSGR